MFAYLFPIRLAALTFLGLSAMVTAPYMLVQYRKYGSVSLYRAGILFSFAFYMLSAYYLTILPLPDPKTLAPMVNITEHIQPVPFRSIADIIARTPFRLNDTATYLPALKDSAFYVTAFNVLLTFPFGVYMGYYFRRNLKATLLLTLLLSLFYEISQLTALFGVYPRPYRLFDVDDIITNVLGGMLGFLFYRRFLRFLPSRERIDEKSLRAGKKVGYTRRLFAFAIDYAIVNLLAAVVFGLLGIETNSLYVLALLFAYILLSQLLFRQTAGKRLVSVKLQPEGEGRGYRLPVLVRYLLLFIPLTCLSALRLLIETVYANGVYAVGYMLLIALLAADMLLGLRKDKTLLYERLSKTRNISTIAPKNKR